MTFVLDASVALTWLLQDGSAEDAPYAFEVLQAFGTAQAHAEVPITWGLEIANVVARCEAKRILTTAQTSAYLDLLRELPIAADADTYDRAFGTTLELARRYGLSSYDASYLELALRHGLPLASLDRDLQKAAVHAGVKLFPVL
jgi:predicted nucleic acid-binding protein